MDPATKSKWEYHNIHAWLIRHKKKTGVCQFCVRIPKRTHNALRHGEQHGRNVMRYVELCTSCHKKYDMTEVTRCKLKSIAMGNTNKARCVVGTDKDGNEHVFSSSKDGAKHVGRVKQSVNNCLRGLSKSSGGYSWHYVNN